MNRPPDNLDDALRAVAAGDLDLLTPEQVARLEDLLNRAPGVAADAAARVPPLHGRLAQANQALIETNTPSVATWQTVWERIDAAAPGVLGPRMWGRGTILFRYWKPLAVAVACLVLAAIWKLGSPPIDPWPMRLATDVEIDELEVYDGAAPFIISTDEENGVKMIWVLQAES